METEKFVCTVVSIVPFEITESKPGLTPGRFTIEASDGETPKILHVSKAIHYVYIDDTRGSLQVRDSPDEVCNSIVNDYVTSQLAIKPNARPGIFWVHGEVREKEVALKFADRLKEAKEAQRLWMVELAKLADSDWNKYHNHQVVADIQRIAAHMIGWKPEEHEWMAPRTAEQGSRCPACGQLNPPAIVVCPACKCILKPEEYKKLQFA